MYKAKIGLVVGLGISLVGLMFAPAFSQKTTVRFLMGPEGPGKGWTALIEKFEAEYPNIKLEMQEGPSATNTREDMYSTSFLAGEATYDLAYADLIWVPKFAAAGWIVDITDRLTPYEIAEFLPGDIAGGMYKGRLYRLPMQSDAGMLYYRKDILEDAGLRPPRTWTELVNQAKKLQNPPDLWGFVWQGNEYEGLICDYLELVWGAGGALLNEEGKVVLDEETGAVDALKFMYDVIHTQRPLFCG